MYALVCFLKEAMRIEERKTTAIVDDDAHDIGKYIIPTINTRKSSDGTLSKYFSIDFFFCNPINNKQPDAISQNLVGIRKYVADWLIG